MNVSRRNARLAGFAAIFCIMTGLVACTAEDKVPVASISAETLRTRLQSDSKPLLIDVREPDEFAAGHIAEAQLIPLGTVEEGMKSVAKDREIVLICSVGGRSAKACKRLAARGYTNLVNAEGGMKAWGERGYPVVK